MEGRADGGVHHNARSATPIIDLDRGKELVQRAQLKSDAGLAVYGETFGGAIGFLLNEANEDRKR